MIGRLQDPRTRIVLTTFLVATVLLLIWRFGLALALAATPFAILTSFLVLLYGSHGWAGAGYAILGFSAGYIGVRLFFAHLPDKIGGAKVGAVKLLESGATPKTSRNGDRLVVEVPRIRLHEVVAVDLV